MPIPAVWIGSLLAVVSSDRSIYLGCQSSQTYWFPNEPFLVAGLQQGRWEGWIGVGPSMEIYRRPSDTALREDEAYLWASAEVHSGVGWVEQDSGLAQTVGLQASWLSVSNSYYGAKWPSEFFKLDAVWGASYRYGKIRLDVGAGPSLIWISNSSFDWRFHLEPTMNLRVSRVW